MRLFVAIDPDERTRAQLADAHAAIQAIVEQSPTPPRITWVMPAVAHVTLRFIGEVPDTVRPSIQRALERIRIAPFALRWETIGTFGGLHHPRVIWIGPTAGTEMLQALAEQVNTELDPVLGAGESRTFRPHLTFGRVREPGRRVNWAKALAAAQWTPTVSRIDRIVLYQSRLSPKGPTYTALSAHG
jgi:2'-5' RNA ligase